MCFSLQRPSRRSRHCARCSEAHNCESQSWILPLDLPHFYWQLDFQFCIAAACEMRRGLDWWDFQHTNGIQRSHANDCLFQHVIHFTLVRKMFVFSWYSKVCWHWRQRNFKFQQSLNSNKRNVRLRYLPKKECVQVLDSGRTCEKKSIGLWKKWKCPRPPRR